MAEAYTEPQSLDKKQNVALSDKIMVTDTTNKTEVVMGLAIIGAEVSCSDAASAENKKVKIANYTEAFLPNNALLHITFTNANTYGDTTAATKTYPKLEVYNSSDVLLATLDVCDSRGHYAGSGCWTAGDVMTIRRIDSKAVIQNSDIRQVVTGNNGYTIYSDGRKEYTVDQVNSALANYQTVKKYNSSYSWNQLYKRIIEEWDALPTGTTIATVIGTNSSCATFLISKMNASYGGFFIIDPYYDDLNLRHYQKYSGKWSVIKFTGTKTTLDTTTTQSSPSNADNGLS